MAPQYKLVYFDIRGRGEAIRWIFKYSGIDFEDVRVKFTEWPALKATTPNGQLPYLEVDGKILTQSVAIARFLARKTGLTGKDEFEAAQADALVDYVNDATTKFAVANAEKDEKKKLALKEEFVKEGVQPFLKGLERHLSANNNGEGFFIGNQPTWADLYLVGLLLDSLVAFDEKVLDSYPLLKTHRQRVHELKGIKEWLLKRPITTV